MRAPGCWILVAAASLVVSSTSSAQDRGHVAGVFGWTFGEQTAPMYGAQFGVGSAIRPKSLARSSAWMTY